jgi:ATP-dependent DNA ligase
MSDISQQIKLIAEEPSTIKKKEIISEAVVMFPGFEPILNCAYDVHKVYGVKDFPVPEEYLSVESLDDPRTRDDLLTILYSLSYGDLKGKKAKEVLTSFCAKLSEDDASVVQGIIERDLRCGIGNKLINEAVGYTLAPDVPPYMRCSLMSERIAEKFENARNFYSQVKADGEFINMVFDSDATFSLITRNGRVFPKEPAARLLREFIATMDCFDKPIDEVMHGELIVVDKKTGKIAPREVGNGLLSSAQKNSTTHDSKADQYKIVFVAWDIIPIPNFETGEAYRVPYSSRFEKLSRDIGKDNPVMRVVETLIVENMEQALKHYRAARAAGEEGTVIKLPDMPWIDGTSTEQVKMKDAKDIDLRIVSMTAGKGKNSKAFGSLTMVSECRKLTVNVSGFSDELRRHIFENFDEVFKGTIATITANSITQSKDKPGCFSLFLPRWKEHRPYKNDGDTLMRIEEIFAATDV